MPSAGEIVSVFKEPRFSRKTQTSQHMMATELANAKIGNDTGRNDALGIVTGFSEEGTFITPSRDEQELACRDVDAMEWV